MHDRFRMAIRALGLTAAALAAGVALAAPKGSTADAADCLQKAAIQFSIDNAQCSAYPPSEARNWCLNQAVQAYASAVAKCSAAAASAGVRGGAISGVDGLTVQQEPGSAGPVAGKPRPGVLPRLAQ